MYCTRSISSSTVRTTDLASMPIDASIALGFTISGKVVRLGFPSTRPGAMMMKSGELTLWNSKSFFARDLSVASVSASEPDPVNRFSSNSRTAAMRRSSSGAPPNDSQMLKMRSEVSSSSWRTRRLIGASAASSFTP